jgi:uncharacterized protein YjbK
VDDPMVETEVKLTISSDGYRTVVEAFQSALYDDIDQWNIFFDTPTGSLRSSSQSARLRSIASLRSPVKWVVTAKRSGRCQDGIWQRPEIEAEIPAASARAILNRPSTFLQHVPQNIQDELATSCNEQFVVIGDFRTFRRVIQFETFHLECDETVLPDHTTFFEIEIETEDPGAALRLISAKLTEFGVAFEPSPTGKLERLMSVPEGNRTTMAFSGN